MFHSHCVRDYMATKLITVAPETEILRAACMLTENKISGAPVVDQDGKLVGIITERDYLQVVLDAGYYQNYGGQVKNFMSKDVITVSPDESIMTIAKRFMDHAHRRYPVLENDQLVGQISRRDVLRVLEQLW